MAAPASSLYGVLEALAGWVRDETGRAGERATENVSAVLRELGFVTQGEFEELELRVAQLEHRLRIVERAAETRPEVAAAPPEVVPVGPDLPPPASD